MSKTTASVSVVACLLALGLHPSPAGAANTRSFISANGDDTNSCARPKPCRTLQKAHDNTNAGGEINMLDPAGYGPVTITKSISIVNDGVGSAGILVPPDGDGITINAGATDIINLRGLIIEGAGAGSTGILFLSGLSLTIENSVVRNLNGPGIALAPNVSSHIAISNTLVANNASDGIYMQPHGDDLIVEAVFNRVEAYKNGRRGIAIYGNLVNETFTLPGQIPPQVSAIAMDSVAAYNQVGFYAVGSSVAPIVTIFSVFRSMTFRNSEVLGGGEGEG
jgi:hypothetical protein